MHSTASRRRNFLRIFLEATALALLLALGLPEVRAEAPNELRTGFQKSPADLTMLKQRNSKSGNTSPTAFTGKT